MATEKSSEEDAKTIDGSNDSAPEGSEASAVKPKESKTSAAEIRTRAYGIFQARHSGPGSAVEDWQKAEASVAVGASTADAPAGAQPPVPTGSPDKSAGNASDGSLSGLTS